MTVTAEPDWLAAALAAFEPVKPSPYITDPVAWVTDKTHEHLWSKQREIAQSVVDNKRTAVKASHAIGKSFVASRIVAWWLDSHPAGEAFVVSTAPTFSQVRAILWREIGKAHRKGKLQGRVNQTEWHLGPELVGYGRKPADQDEHGFQGIHAKYVLAILDEACGVPRQFWTAVEAITTNTNCRILAIGNPDDPASEFANKCKPGSGWNVISVPAASTPNFTGEKVPDNVRELLIDPPWVEDFVKGRGTEHPEYISKVTAEFPETSTDTLIPLGWIVRAQERDAQPIPTDPSVLGVDVARYGTDDTVIYHRHGPRVRRLKAFNGKPTTETTGEVIHALTETGAQAAQVDGVGVGGGVVDMLREQYKPVNDMQAGKAADDSERFINARAEWYWGLRERFEQGAIDLDPADEDLAAELSAIKFKYTSRGQVQIESKEDMKKRGVSSPDHADAVMLAFASYHDDGPTVLYSFT